MAYSERILDELCGYLKAHLDQPIGLTEMERFSGFSRRSLQYAFLKRFQCSPLAWLRTERLALARKILLSAEAGLSVTQVALACGFPQLSRFSERYKKCYKELPSETRRRHVA